jgi:hypothetical protein
MPHEINIVYFTYINPNKNYKDIIQGQLNDIVVSGIGINSKLFIVISCEFPELINEVENIITQKLLNTNVNYELTIEPKNIYEYYGIKKVYDLAKADPDKYYIYLHGKGMMNEHGEMTKTGRTKSNLSLTRSHLYPWEKILNLFKSNQNIVVAASFVGPRLGWFNFWWASGKYLSTCEDPRVSLDHRHYYEGWLSSGSIENEIFYNLTENDYTQYEPGKAIEELQKTFAFLGEIYDI